jgi:hypothetical protein
MQAADKTKMDGITAGAQPTSLTLIQTALNTLPVDSTPATSESMYSNASQFTITNLKDTLQISYDTRYYIPGATSASEFRSSVAGMQFRAITGGTSAAMHVDANDFYILFSDTATGTYNSRRPLRLNRSTGMFSDTAFTASGRVSGSDLLSGSVVYAGGGSAYLNTDGNIIGPTWTSSSLYAHIESRANAYGALYQNGSVTSTRMAGNVTPVVSFGNGGGFQEFSGYVVTGIRSSTSNSIGWSARQPQVYTANGGWVAAFAF